MKKEETSGRRPVDEQWGEWEGYSRCGSKGMRLGFCEQFPQVRNSVFLATNVYLSLQKSYVKYTHMLTALECSQFCAGFVLRLC